MTFLRLWMVVAITVLGLGGCASFQQQKVVQSSWLPASAPAPTESLTLPLHAPVDSSTAPSPKIAIIDELPPPQKVGRSDSLLAAPHPIRLSAKQFNDDIRARALASHKRSPRIKNDPDDAPLIFDIPVAYNARVKYWIQHFQSPSGRPWFQKWLERSTRYMPSIQRILKQHGLPKDLAYMAMIESGFSSRASSTAQAVGPWQFIRETGNRYGLKTTWWLDERRDFEKSTQAASKYMKRMYSMFNSWYLVAAAYNTGENRIKKMIEKHNTHNFWKLSKKKALVEETKDYVPKMIAAMLISKAPQLYGFRHVNWQETLEFEHFRVPGGTRLDKLADALGVTPAHMRELNPELVRGYVPPHVEGHLIRIPKGSAQLMARYIRKNFLTSN